MPKVRVYTDYDPIVIQKKSAPNGKGFVDMTDESMIKAGWTGNYFDVELSDLPTGSKDRHAWKYDPLENKVKINPVKVQAKLDAKAAKEARKQAVLAKLKISKDELEDLLK